MSLTAGDPLTPGYAATKDAPRLNPEDVEGLAKIPSLPLSYRDALPLLKAMEGHGVRGEHDWAGGLEEVSYFSGPTEGDAYLENIVDNKITPIWNTIGVIEGSEDPDRVIVLGMFLLISLMQCLIRFLNIRQSPGCVGLWCCRSQLWIFIHGI